MPFRQSSKVASARLELARHMTWDFKSHASAITPRGQNVALGNWTPECFTTDDFQDRFLDQPDTQHIKADEVTWTLNPLITNQMLYQLSHVSIIYSEITCIYKKPLNRLCFHVVSTIRRDAHI